jgi:hypothetical protein
MKSTKLLFALLAAITLIHAAAATASAIDMDDPRRLVGREDDIRIDAQLVQDTVSPGAPIGVTFQIQNLTARPVAIADKVATASYDEDSRTVTVAIGAEVPPDGRMPHLVVIAPGEKKLFRAGATPAFNAAAIRSAMGVVPRYVQVKVSILRDLEPFEPLLGQPGRMQQTLSDAQFDSWFESNDSIFLNSVPVRYSPRRSSGFAGADRRDASGGF